MERHSERLERIRKLAWLLTVLSFLVVLVSAYIRLSGAGLGCTGWPDCYGQLLTAGGTTHTGAVRILHRSVASLSLLLGFYLAWQCLRPQPVQPLARHATLLLVLMIVLALVGVWGADPHRAWTSFFNMLGGVGLVTLSWRMVVAAGPAAPGPAPARSTAVLHAGLIALGLAIALGALIGARFAATACMTTPSCAGSWWPAAEGWGALNPFARVAAPAMPGDAGGVALHLLHRYCAVSAVLLLGIAGLRAQAAEATRGIGKWLLVLVVLEFALGGLTVVSGFSLWLAVGHSVGAAALLAVGAQLMARSRVAAA
ncbi:COX15/CtaA family protein [Sulfuritalea hydrogenivorans]|uniref:Cytochrome oxidase assembly n=1 Tax=Sulfuritalea hydrogenivorans sk43H TaxID=1223802 RepID=W0SDD4_9PROT|nr:COX15/CtaA family protein [Sulfuritalea hydrogenivorans]BAO29071.1 cytochrome oxidase assembly [Sulfuritalea hydrogenivorans sk43H]